MDDLILVVIRGTYYALGRSIYGEEFYEERNSIPLHKKALVGGIAVVGGLLVCFGLILLVTGAWEYSQGR